MTSSPDTPASSPVAPDSFSGELIPGLPNHLVVTHVLGEEKMPDPTDLARLRAVSKGMRKAVAETERTLKEPNQREAVAKGYLSTVKHMHSRGLLYREEFLCAAAASSGQLEELKALRAKNFPWDVQTCAKAARGGHLAVLKWAREKKCPWDKSTCAYAAQNGHLEVLKWARENDCPWDELICAGAAKGGHLAVLQWARANGCPWNEDTCAGAAAGGHLEVLKWARENDCPWDFRTLSCAHKHHEVMQWAILNGCPQGYDDYYDSGFDTEFGHSDDPFVDPWHDSEDEEDDGFW